MPPRMGRASARFAPAALLALLAVALLLPAVPGGKVLSGTDLVLFQSPYAGVRPAALKQPSNPLLYDAAWVFHPGQQFNRAVVRDGRLPLWNPHLSAGRPQLAAHQSALLYPPGWLSYVLPYWDSLVVVALLKLMIAGLGAFFLCRALGLSLAPALLAGVTFAFATYLVAWMSHPHSNVYVLVPWLLLLAERVCRRGTLADGTAFAAVLGVAALGGQPESLFVVLLPVVAWFAFRLLTIARVEGVAARRAGMAVAGIAIGLAVGAVVIVPFVELLANSYNTSRGSGPLPARSAYALFFPELWGRPDKFELAGGPINFQERTGYFGAVAALLAAAGLVARRPRAEQLFFAAMGVLALLTVLDSGPFADAIRELPMFSRVNLNRALVLVALAGAMLAAYGLQAALDGDAAARRRMLIAIALAALAPPLVWMAKNGHTLSSWRDALGELPSIGDDPRPGAVVSLAAVLRWCLVALPVLALIGALVLRPRRARLVAGLIVAVAALDLIALDRGYQPAIDRELADPRTPPAVDFARGAVDHQRVVGDFESLGPDTASRFRLADARGHQLPVVERYQRLWTTLGGIGFQRALVRLADPRAPRLLDAFSVRFAFQGSTADAPARPLRRVFDRQGEAVFENPGALPRAWVAYGWRRTPDLDGSLRYMARASTAEMRDRPAIEGVPQRTGPARATPARVVSESDTEVRLDVVARRPGRLVLSDTFYPGWQAEVDGREAEIKPTNAAFRSVAVPRGRHDVRFRYRPATVLLGGTLSLLALAALGAAAVVAVRRRGRPAGSRG